MNKLPRDTSGVKELVGNEMPRNPNEPLGNPPYKTPTTTGYEGDSPSMKYGSSGMKYGK